MPRSRDFQAYHRSIAAELDATKDRIRHLIGGNHWGEDGRQKEVVLRRALRTHIADSLHVGTGFVVGPDSTSRRSTSHQTDILLCHRNKPTLFRDGELFIVTPDAVAGIIEVKTNFANVDLPRTLETLADDIALIRENGNQRCQAGLFIYVAGESISHARLLEQLSRAANGNPDRVVNWVAVGGEVFVRYWSHGSEADSPVDGAVWHSYRLPGLAQAYFISNVVWDTGSSVDEAMQFAWFPVEGSKELSREMYIALDGSTASSFGYARSEGH